MLAYVSHRRLNLYCHAASAPIWHALATPDNAIALNVAAAVVTALGLAFAVRRLLFGDTEIAVRWTPLLFAASFFAVPPFLRHLLDLSPVMFGLLPIALSLAALACQDWLDFRKVADDDGSVNFGRFGLGIGMSGAFAAIAAWEGTLGLAFAPLALILALSPVAIGPRGTLRRKRRSRTRSTAFGRRLRRFSSR